MIYKLFQNNFAFFFFIPFLIIASIFIAVFRMFRGFYA